MNTNNLAKGQIYNSYKKLCDVVEESTKAGNAKKKQLSNWETYFKWRKDKYKFIIEEVYPIDDFFTEQEMVNKYGNLEILEMYCNNGFNFSKSQRIMFHALLNEKIKFNMTEDYKYRIIEEFTTALPRNIDKMKKGMYQYIIPLILHNIVKNKNNENHILNITLHKLARKINMINYNYDIIKYNKDIFSSYETMESKETCDGIPIYFDKYNLDDFYQRIDKQISYFVKNSIELMKAADMIDFQQVFYVELVKKNVEIDKINFNISNNEEHIIRRATEQEITMHLDWRHTAMIAAEIDPLIDNKSQCWYGKKAPIYQKEYQKLIDNYNKEENDSKYLLLKVYKTYEIFATNITYCENCLKYFNCKDMNVLIDLFNNEFGKLINMNAERRTLKKNKYNENYLKDYSNIIDITIPTSVSNIKENKYFKEQIKIKSQKKFTYTNNITYKNC